MPGLRPREIRRGTSRSAAGVTDELDVLWKDDGRLYCRGWRRSETGEDYSVLIVLPSDDAPPPSLLSRIAHEYRLRDVLDSAWAVCPLALENENGRVMLVLDDPAAMPLQMQLGRPMELEKFLRLAIDIAVQVGEVHRHGIVHKDLKPTNILVHHETGDVRITGFGIASQLPRERPPAGPSPEVIAGTLAYMAPEQTGRMNRSIDARSDLYALGITLYQMLTGELPLSASDPISWVHSHIARQPIPPSELLENVPLPVSAIIMRLLAKMPEDRYQTAAGVEADLRRCLAEWCLHGVVGDFPLRQHDRQSRLLLPEKLYGREREIATLVAGFDRLLSDGVPELILVSGYSGVGKSSVVNELHKELLYRNGLFASGKFDQYKRDVPYSTLVQAFQCLVLPLLGKSESELTRWRDELLQALGMNGQLVLDLVPELRHIIGDQPPIPDLPAQQAQIRYHLVLRHFIGVFARAQHPLVLFLDDLQWLDASTLNLLEDLLTCSDLQHLMIVGAYRSNEVLGLHPLAHKLGVIRAKGARVSEIVLDPLGKEQLGNLIADSLKSDSVRVAPLVDLVQEKTGGNPLFVMQFLSSLVEEGLLIFDHDQAGWRWDSIRIRAKGYTLNVVDLMVGRLTRLPVEAQTALKTLACLGSSADIGLISVALAISEDRVDDVLWPALRQELVERVGVRYGFIHDRFQEAAYGLIPAEERTGVHLQLGRRLAKNTSPELLGDVVFDVVDQLNRGAMLITTVAEREYLAELNMLAGTRAKACVAYSSALTYFTAGASLLIHDVRARRPELSFSLALNRAECSFILGDFLTTEAVIDDLLGRGASALDLSAVYCLQIELRVVQSQNELAVASALEALRLFDIHFSAHPDQSEVQREFDTVLSKIEPSQLEEIAGLPLMTDPTMLAVMRILAEVWPPAYFTDFNLVTLAVCRMVNVSLQYGSGPASIQGFALLGWLMGPAFGRFEEGYQLAHFACNLVPERNTADYARAVDILGLTASWTRPLSEAIDWWRVSHQVGVEAGDLFRACYPGAHISLQLLMQGQNLPQALSECREYLTFAERVGFSDGADLIRTIERTMTVLSGIARDESDDCNSGAIDLSHSRMIVIGHWYWTRTIMLRFLAADYTGALEAAAKVNPARWAKIVQIQHLDYHYFCALALAAVIDDTPGEQQEQFRTRLEDHHTQLKTWYEQTQSPTLADKHVLIAAEIARLEGRNFDAHVLYEQAIALARENGFLNYEAVAHETAERFHRRHGAQTSAHAHLARARSCYLQWGAYAKVSQIDDEHPELSTATRGDDIGTMIVKVDQLDLATIIRVSQTLAREPTPDDVVSTLMRLALEHAGAQRAVLIALNGSAPRIAAEASIGPAGAEVDLVDASFDASQLASFVVRYVIRTKELVCLQNASTDAMFHDDPWIREQNARSLLCLPLTSQGRFSGILHLENNLSTGVFTSRRVVTLQLIASQAAISVENARLYRDLAEREGKIRRLVDSDVIGIVFWDLDGRILEANDAFLNMVQYEREDLHGGMRWFDMTPPEWQEAHITEEAEELRTTGMMRAREKEFFRKDGGRVPVLIGAAVFDQQPNQGVAYILDLTERKRAEAEAHESEQRYREVQMELAHANRAATMGQLTGSIAHEINQPIAATVTSAEAALRWLSRDPPDTVEVGELLAQIVGHGTRAGEIIHRVRDLIRKAPPRQEVIQINDPIREVIELVSVQALKNAVSIDAKLVLDLPLIRGDRVQLQQVMLNLAMNGIEALSDDDGRPRTLLISTGMSSSGEVLVTVQDTGSGLQDVRHIFDAFYTTKVDGMGMGLSICRSIVEAHGGQIWAETGSRGAVFRFTLPRA